MISRANLAKRLSLTIIAAIALGRPISIFSDVEAQSEIKPTATVAPANQQGVIKADQLNQRAQAAYYQAATAKLREKPKKWYVIDNPATLLTVLGALAAAFWTIFSYFQTYRATLRNQMDTQFYEALKRFGDKDSPSMRSSAIGLLTQMAESEFVKSKRRRSKQSLNADRPYFDTTLEQLIAGLSLEENPIVLRSITDAIRSLSLSTSPDQLVAKMYEQNLTLQEGFVLTLAEFYASVDPSLFKSLPYVTISDELRTEATAATDIEQDVISVIESRHSKRFRDLLQSALHKAKASTDTPIPVDRANVAKALQLAALRLNLNVELCSAILRRVVSGGLDLKDVYLTGANLRKAKLPGANLVAAQLQMATMNEIDLCDANLLFANLQGAELMSARLSRTDLRSANLQPIIERWGVSRLATPKKTYLTLAWLDSADLQSSHLEDASMVLAVLDGTKLADAKMDNADMNRANWWSANFERYDKTIDQDLIRKLYNRFQTAVPPTDDQLHPSVRDFVSKQRKLT